jgi:hypothetical protein
VAVEWPLRFPEALEVDPLDQAEGVGVRITRYGPNERQACVRSAIRKTGTGETESFLDGYINNIKWLVGETWVNSLCLTKGVETSLGCSRRPGAGGKQVVGPRVERRSSKWRQLATRRGRIAIVIVGRQGECAPRNGVCVGV